MNGEIIAVVFFVIPMIFWAGSTYNRISAIEKTLADIKALFPALAEVATLREQYAHLSHEVRILRQAFESEEG